MVGRFFGCDVDVLNTLKSNHRIDNNNIHGLKYSQFHFYI
jgi:hypothetical protein